MVVLFGVNGDMKVVRNTIAWSYTKNYCEDVPARRGDDIGWIALEDFAPPNAAFCDAVAAVATSPPDPEPDAVATYSVGAKSAKSIGILAKSAKKGKTGKGDEVEDAGSDAKAQKSDGMAEEMNVPHHAKTAKLFKDTKSSKKDHDAKSAKSVEISAKSAKSVEISAKSAKKMGKGVTGDAKAQKTGIKAGR